MPNIVYIACSMDGYIADKNGSIEWLTAIPNECGSDFGYAEFMECIDGIIMGRNTFETVLGFSEWPYTKPVFIISSTMKEIPEHLTGKCSIVSGEISTIIQELNNQGICSIYVDGGKTIQSFLAEDLIDEMTVTTVAKVLGSGTALFGSTDHLLDFKIVSTEQLNEYFTKTVFVRKRND